MIKGLIVTNIMEGIPQRDVEAHLKLIQTVAGKHNICIANAVIDHSKDQEPYMTDILNLIEDFICDADCDVIVLDDTFGYEFTKTYLDLKKLADICNTPVYLYEDGKLQMSEENENFDYDSVPFEVYEMKFTDSDEYSYEEVLDEVKDICTSFQEELLDMSFTEQIDELRHLVMGLSDICSQMYKQLDGLRKEQQGGLKKGRK